MKIVLYTNILTPYRKYFYDLLNKICKENGDEFSVLVMAETEPNRAWKYDEFRGEYTRLLKNKMLSFGEIFIHFNSDLKSSIKELKPDIVICAGSYLCPGVWKISRLKKKLNYKCLYWSESHLEEQRSYNKGKLFVRETLRKTFYKRYDGFWYAGRLSKEFIEKYAKEDAKYFLVPNLIDEAKYKKAGTVDEEKQNKIREKLNIAEDKTVFISPVRLSPVKGVMEFLEVFKNSKEKENAVILIAGAGELEERIKKEVSKSKLDVRLLGYKSQREVIELYSASDIFLLPSLSDPNPLTCIEALWAKLPLFISRHCGNFYEVVKNGENGYVFSYENKEEATKMLDRIIKSDKKWRENASEVSKEIAEEKYNSKKVTKRILSEMKRDLRN